MKFNKIHLTMSVSLIIMFITVLISFSLDSRSQKLPAVVKADKIVVSSRVNGIVDSFQVIGMQRIQQNSVITKLTNNKLTFKREALLQEKEKYENLIASASSGDVLNMELMELDEKIHKNLLDKDEQEAEFLLNKEKLSAIKMRYKQATIQHTADAKMYQNGITSFSEYGKSSEDYWKIQEKYHELKSDSLLFGKSINNSAAITTALTTRKEILSRNEEILASKYLLALDKLKVEINEVEQDISDLTLLSPVDGIITDLNKRSGEEVSKGDLIAEISNLDNTWLTAYGNSFSTKKIRIGNRVIIYSNSGEKISGIVRSVSPVMEKVKYLSSSLETANTYTKIEIDFESKETALQKITPGERLFVRILYKN